jgi:hypothetical protein
MELETIQKANPDWLEVCGQTDAELSESLHTRVKSLVGEGEFSWDEVAYVAAVSMKAGSKSLSVSDLQLEKIRRACQLWDVDLHIKELSSHRPFVGPIIVGFKKLLYPILKAFLKDFIRQQRSFNAAALALIIDRYSEDELNDSQLQERS